MINRVKKILGIEGVKVNLSIPEGQSKDSGILKGELELSALSDRTIKSIELKIIETYARGRGEYRRINDYVLGELAISKKVKIGRDEKLSIPFEIPFEVLVSEMDSIAKKSFIKKPIIGLAKWIRKVKSTYTLKVDVSVVGTRLQPSIREKIQFKD